MAENVTEITADFVEFGDIVLNSLQPNHQACVAIGPPGIGKTQMAFGIAAEMQNFNPDFGSCYYNFGGSEVMAAMGVLKNSPDLMTRTGVPPWARPYTHKDPSLNLRGVFRKLYDPKANNLANLDAQTALDPFPMGVSIFDEVKTSPDKSLQMALTEWWCEGRIGDWGVPTGGWARIGFTNDVTDRAGVKPFFAHERNRLLIIHLTYSLNYQCEVWRKMGLREEFVLFARNQPSLVLSAQVPAEDRQFSTARSWTEAHHGALAWMVNKMELGVDDPLPMNDKVFCMLIEGRVGSAVMTEFRRFMTDKTATPTYEEIIANPKGVEIPVDPRKQRIMADSMIYAAQLEDVLPLVDCAKRMMKQFASVFYAGTSKRFGSVVARKKDWLNFGDWCGSGAKLQANAGLED